MSTLIIPFRTLRMHDSPFLNLKGNLIFKFILETNKIPNKSPFDEKLNSTTWSIPMAWFYINCLENHVKDLHNAGFDVEVVVTDNPNKTIQDILATKKYSKFVTDYSHDPFVSQNFNEFVQIETTSMLDWHDKENYEFAKKIFQKNPYAQTTKIKKYIHEYLKKNTTIRTHPAKKSNNSKQLLLENIDQIKTKLKTLAESHNPKISLFPFAIFEKHKLFL